jgi:hypothetical protein
MTAPMRALGGSIAAGVVMSAPAAFADGPGLGRHDPGHGRDQARQDGYGKAAAALELAGESPAARPLIAGEAAAGGAAIVISRRRRQS